MFTGIVETTGILMSATIQENNRIFWISSTISDQLTVDQSVNHDGVCLTIEEVKSGLHRITAIEETLIKSNLSDWQKGQVVNLERSLPVNGRLDGHLVQGHVDATVICRDITSKNGSWQYRFEYEEQFAPFIIEKGSISLNGISLTVFNASTKQFEIGIIPFTYEHTNIKNLKIGSKANVEFDMIGKYINRYLQLSRKPV